MGLDHEAGKFFLDVSRTRSRRRFKDQLADRTVLRVQALGVGVALRHSQKEERGQDEP